MNDQFSIALVNVWWSPLSIDCRYFNSVADQIAYFENLGEGKWLPRLNFNIGDNVKTFMFYKDPNRSFEELTHCNYLIVKWNENGTTNYRYFFAKCYQDSGTQLRVELELDDIQTNYFRYKDQIEPCQINRACIDRFIKNEDGTYSFNGTPESKLFENEDNLNLPQRLVKRTKIEFVSTGNTDADNWLKENVAYWVYVFIDKYHQYKTTGNDSQPATLDTGVTTLSYEFDNGVGQTSDIGCICYPVYKTTNTIRSTKGDTRYPISYLGLSGFRDDNSQASYFYAIKYSMLCPLDLSNVTVSISENDLILSAQTWDSSNGYLNYSKFFTINTSSGSGIFTKLKQSVSALTASYEISDQFTFSKSELLNQTKNYKFNPKLLSQGVKALTLASNGETFSYDIQKINSKDIELLYTESIQPEITKFYCRLKPTGLYSDGSDKNFTGLVASIDNGVSLSNDQYSNFIANNKNFWLQSNFKIIESMGRSAIGGAIAGKGVGALISAGVQGLTSVIDRSLTIDNLKASPSMLKNANGNAVFNMFINDLAMYIEEYDSLENEKIIANDYMVKFGFAVNQIGNIAEYDNIRTLFNYVSAYVDVISAPLSNDEKMRLIERLKGIRFWNSDKIDYNIENIERSVANG